MTAKIDPQHRHPANNHGHGHSITIGEWHRHEADGTIEAMSNKGADQWFEDEANRQDAARGNAS